MKIGQFPKKEACKPIQASQPHLSILVPRLDVPVNKLCEQSNEVCKSLVCDSIFSVISWYKAQLRTLGFLEIDFVSYKVGICSHKASRSLPHIFVCSVDVFPEGGREEVGWERFDKYAIIIPDKVETDFLDNNNAAASSGLEVERGDVGMIWSKSLG